MSKAEWSYYDDMFPEGNEDGFNSDSDFEYDDSYSRKKSKSGGKKGGSKPKGVSYLETRYFFDWTLLSSTSSAKYFRLMES